MKKEKKTFEKHFQKSTVISVILLSLSYKIYQGRCESTKGGIHEPSKECRTHWKTYTTKRHEYFGEKYPGLSLVFAALFYLRIKKIEKV